MEIKSLLTICVLVFFLLVQLARSLPEPGRWSFTLTQKDEERFFSVPKSLYKGSTVSISVSCTPNSVEKLNIGWVLRQSPCYEEYLERSLQDSFSAYYGCPELAANPAYSTIRYLKEPEQDYECTHFDLKETRQKFVTKKTTEGLECRSRAQYSPPAEERVVPGDPVKAQDKPPLETLPTASPEQSGQKKDDQKKAVPQSHRKRAADQAPKANATLAATSTLPPVAAGAKEPTPAPAAVVPPSTPKERPRTPEQTSDHQVVVDQDGVYLLIVQVIWPGNKNLTAIIDVKMKNGNGYLSAVDWPLLPFYGVMCGLYVILAIAWLTVSALQWRDLLRIQFWIGGVIFLGLVEKAVFLNEFQSINSTGEAGHAGMLFAEVVSCLKRTLARLLVIVVSLGFGIVKPRLGPALHRIVGVGSLYFLLCTVEGCLRVLKTKNDPSNQTIMAEIPLAVLDSAICWWIFSSLVQTTRTLRLRRNVVKLGLYRHFTNTLVFSVLASVVYMTWSLYNHRLTNCLSDWKELWVDEAYWHILFSIILMVIMVLWRPTNNNQRYAFTPLLDAMDDDEEDSVMEKENTAISDVYGTKSRNNSGVSGPKGQLQNAGAVALNSRPKDHKEDENLKWVEDNIPSSLTDTALPSLLDSDEEIMTVRYERNKME